MTPLRLSELLFSIRGYVLLLASVLAAILAILGLLPRRNIRSYASQVDGPPKSDWFFGNLTDLHFRDAGDPQLSWQKLYGSVFKVHGLFGAQYLMISDPKAVKHVYTNVDGFAKRGNVREMLKAMTGPGLAVVDGDDHRRQRRIMQPAFGITQLKALFPIFVRHSQHLSSVLRKDIDAQGDGTTVKIDMYNYISKISLDVIGDAAFDHDFGALDDKQDSFREAISKTRTQSFECMSKTSIFIQYIIDYLPPWMVYCLTHLPIEKFANIQALHDISMELASKMVKDKLQAYQQGLGGSKDLMTLLVRANATEKQENKLSDVEVNSEIITMTLGAHGTTTNSISFGLWELAKNADLQQRIRTEILDMKRQTSGQVEINDFENMPLLNAFIKEVLRYHAVAFTSLRDASKDGVIPLSKPERLLSGRLVNEIPVSKGQRILINIIGYNRLPELFGPDSDEFSIDRWLDGMRNTENRPRGIGIYANMISFGHGTHSCIGWRFALWEMQAIIVELLSNFQFTLSPEQKAIRKIPSSTMAPGVQGKRGVAPSMALVVSNLQD